jgi:hypothetical protein
MSPSTAKSRRPAFAAYALKLGPKAVIGDDVVAGGYSLDAAQGSSVGGALILAAYQALLNGQVSERADIALGALEMNGVIDGDTQLAIDQAENSAVSPTYMMGNDVPAVPSVKPGLNFGGSQDQR